MFLGPTHIFRTICNTMVPIRGVMLIPWNVFHSTFSFKPFLKFLVEMRFRNGSYLEGPASQEGENNGENVVKAFNMSFLFFSKIYLCYADYSKT